MINHKLLIVLSLIIMNCGLKGAAPCKKSEEEAAPWQMQALPDKPSYSAAESAYLTGQNYLGLAIMLYEASLAPDLTLNEQLNFRDQADMEMHAAASVFVEADKAGKDRNEVIEEFALATYIKAEAYRQFAILFHGKAKKAGSDQERQLLEDHAKSDIATAIRFYQKSAHYNHIPAIDRLSELRNKGFKIPILQKK